MQFKHAAGKLGNKRKAWYWSKILICYSSSPGTLAIPNMPRNNQETHSEDMSCINKTSLAKTNFYPAIAANTHTNKMQSHLFLIKCCFLFFFSSLKSRYSPQRANNVNDKPAITTGWVELCCALNIINKESCVSLSISYMSPVLPPQTASSAVRIQLTGSRQPRHPH